jgi:hypothetical protein
VYKVLKVCAKCVICTFDTLDTHIYSNSIQKCNSSVVILIWQRMVGRPRHSPRVDVVQLASRPWPPSLVALSLWIRTWGGPHKGWNRAVLPSRGQRQPAEDRRHGHNVDDRFRAWLVQLLRPRDPRLAPPGRLPAVALGVFVVCTKWDPWCTPGHTFKKSVHQCGQVSNTVTKTTLLIFATNFEHTVITSCIQCFILCLYFVFNL